MEYLKQARTDTRKQAMDVRNTVSAILADIEENGQAAIEKYSKELDGWTCRFAVSGEEMAEKSKEVPQDIMKDLHFAHEQVHSFALKQRESLQGFKTRMDTGAVLGQRVIPCRCAGCYVPGGRFMHATSAIMSIATARAAGVPYVVACSPSHKQQGIPPLVLAAMSICQPDIVLTLGGVQAVAAMAFGLFSERPADVIVGPGNRFVAEAKRQLFGRVGIDMIAGPSESLIIADSTADPVIVAVDLMSQAEHGYDSPVWLVTDSRKLGEEVMDLVPRFIKTLPYPEVANQSWADYGQVILCSNREEMVQISDTYAPEHLQVQAGDQEWWLDNLTNYGSLFLGEGSTVTYGDKAAGTNHILPTSQAARYTGGLSVGKFLKTVTYQSIPPVESFRIGAASSRLSRAEGMEGHARAADVRLQKYFPDYEFDFEIFNTSEYFVRSG